MIISVNIIQLFRLISSLQKLWLLVISLSEKTQLNKTIRYKQKNIKNAKRICLLSLIKSAEAERFAR